MEEGLWTGSKTKHLTQNVKRLEITPRVGVQLSRCNIQYTQHTHGKLVEGKADMGVSKKTDTYRRNLTHFLLGHDKHYR